MEVNKKKSGIMLHKGKLNCTASSHISGVKTLVHRKSHIPIVDSYKYLGIMIDKHLNFQEHLSYIRDKIKRPQKIIDIMKWKKCSKWHIIYSWLTYIAPHFRYGALIYYKLCRDS